MYHDDVHLHPQLLSLLTASEIFPAQDFKGQSHYRKVKGQIKVIPSINLLHLTDSEI